MTARGRVAMSGLITAETTSSDAHAESASISRLLPRSKAALLFIGESSHSNHGCFAER
jgi:hypothetical protein